MPRNTGHKPHFSADILLVTFSWNEAFFPLYIFFQKPSCAKPLQPSLMPQANLFFFSSLFFSFFFFPLGFISTAEGDYWEMFSHSSWKSTQVSYCLWAWTSQLGSLSSDKDRKKNLVLRIWEEHLSQCLILYCKNDIRSLAHTRCKISHISSSFYKLKKKNTLGVLVGFRFILVLNYFSFIKLENKLPHLGSCGISHQSGCAGQ